MKEFVKSVIALAFTIVLAISLLFACSIKAVKAQQFNCVPRMVEVTIGDDTPGNPKATFTTELGCVYNIFTSVENLLPVNTPVIFSNVNYVTTTSEGIIKVSGEGVVIGYQITRLIQSQAVLYIIQFDGNKQLRLHPYEFETQ